MKQILCALFIGLWASSVLAHSPLERSNPEDGSTVAGVPAELVLKFRGKIRLTRVTLQTGSQTAVDVDLSSFDGFGSDYVLPLPTSGSGVNLIEWRGLGDDGHAMTGTVRFTVD